MKIPQSPPAFGKLLEQVGTERLGAVMQSRASEALAGKYLHWDEMRHRAPPGDLSVEEWWLATKFGRMSQYQQLPLADASGSPFRYALLDPLPERLHTVDMRAGGRIDMPPQIAARGLKDRYLVGSLVEEAIRSSQLEGAVTTRAVAKEMIRAGRPPRDRSEQMIFNNYHTMQRISNLKKDPLSPEMVFDIHRRVTMDALDDPSGVGRLRRPEEKIHVVDEYGTVFHEPPPAEQLEQRLAAMCDFANGKTPEWFVHPVIRSIILHFWLAYDHPFIDGNGRTARALFYWSMLHRGFWLCEFISISQIMLKAPAKYGRAFLYTETDENDVTYFLMYHLKVIQRAIDELHEYVEHKTDEQQALERDLRGLPGLNHRQRALIGHAIRHPCYQYTVESHRTCHDVVYDTARTDLLALAEAGLLDAGKVGRTWHFTPVTDLEERLRGWP